MSSEDSSEEEEPAPKPAAPRRRRKTPSPVRRELVPAWQGGGAAGRSSADDLALGQYTGQAGTPVEISIASGEPVEPGWPALPGALKQHQKDGVRFMWKKTVRKGKGCILAHCMGLGKTLAAVAFLRRCLAPPRGWKGCGPPFSAGHLPMHFPEPHNAPPLEI